jgi:ATP-dependent helicase/nuclease subunit A
MAAPGGPGDSGAADAQRRAADPTLPVWVAANAGSGKTRVLTDRVARLLFAGTPPARILCLTYTRAAAAEMQERLFRRLGGWAMLPDDRLAAELAELTGATEAPAHEALARARRLFAAALDTPGGLRIQTIHAFCDAILRRFPLEAGVTPAFRVQDARSGAETVEALRDDLALRAERGEDPAFDAMAAILSEEGLAATTGAVMQHRDAFPPNLGRAGLARILGLPRERTPAERLDLALGGRTADDLARIAAALSAGSGKYDVPAAAALRAVGTSPPDAALLALERAFLTGDGEPRKPRGFPTKDALQAAPWLGDTMAGLKSSILAAREDRLAHLALDRAERLHRYGRALLDSYEAAKAAAGQLDFHDLVVRTRHLLTGADMAAWALWKLDRGFDHILIDEAQDTSPPQWEVIAALAAEALSGEGAREVRRTLFVVGDLKQSIYSFQGADPRAFDRHRADFGRRLAALGTPLHEGTLRHSFRSGAAILEVVDRTFEAETSPGFAGPGGPARHLPFRPLQPGRVELWPWLPKPAAPAAREWDDPQDSLAADDPRLRLAALIAAEVAGWLAAGRLLPGDAADPPRPMRPGDILILVQRRAILARALVGALKAHGVPVAGEDRLILGRELAVKDILAVLRFVATPADDLSLAAALRSPLFGLSEDALFALAAPRGERSLWQALRGSGHGTSIAALADLRDHADFLRPYELIDRLLTRHGGRRALVARLGAEVEDAIDELLAQAIAYEAAEPPSLEGFLRWIDAGDIPVIREQDARSDRVRVMTVHGAKGLEAPVVILPDTGGARGGRPGPIVTAHGVALWRSSATERPAAVAAAVAAAEAAEAEERRRLLYVALTRASSLLVVAGAGERPAADDWYSLVATGMARAGAREEPAPAGFEGVRRVVAAHWTEGAAAPAVAPAPAGPVHAGPLPAGPLPVEPVHVEPVLADPLPAWALAPPPPAAGRPRSLNPSLLGGPHALPGEAGEETEAALARGSALHALLERLPAIAPAGRAAAALRLAGPGGEALAAEALAVLALPEAAPLFGPGSLGEVPFVATIAAPGGDRGAWRLEGRIDRLLAGPDGILAADYKSNRVVPGSAEAVPEGILRQMGAYQAALERIWPGRPVACAILWTAVPRLMVLPRDQLLAALARAAPIS